MTIKTFEANGDGRDFVIGDLHGSYSRLEELLVAISFDRAKDRLFSVGDLVDRGPESLRCLELLYEPWFHAVLSNHEQMMLEAFRGGYMGQFWLRNGGMWGAEALNTWRNNRRFVSNELDRPRPPSDEEHRLYDLLEKVEALPLLITIGLRDGKKVHVIHAELPPGNVITDEVLADPEKVLELAKHQSDDGDFLIWGRHLYYRFYKAHLADIEKVRRTVAYNHSTASIFNDQLSHVISGHTIVQQPLTLLGQTNIDTGAYGSYHPGAKWEALTCLELSTWTFHQVGASGYRVVEPVVVRREDLQSKHMIGAVP